MIILEKTEVYNFQGALRGLRNPFESWDKSFFNDTATTEIYTALNTLSLHDALPFILQPY